jgi:hypothetical protein
MKFYLLVDQMLMVGPLPQEELVTALGLLSRLQKVDYSYSNGCYKFDEVEFADVEVLPEGHKKLGAGQDKSPLELANCDLRKCNTELWSENCKLRQDLEALKNT